MDMMDITVGQLIQLLSKYDPDRRIEVYDRIAEDFNAIVGVDTDPDDHTDGEMVRICVGI